MQPNTRAVFAESLGNPSLAVLDIAAVADVAHAHGVPLVIDNTVPSPYLCNPLALGADIVVHSATKYLAGHGTTLGGVVVEGGKFPWDNGKFPGMTEPSPGYHGVKFYETFGDFGFTMRCRMESLRVFGAALSPMSAWQILQGVETLPLRMERHSQNGAALADWLKTRAEVAWVSYIGHAEHASHARAKAYLRPGAFGSLVSFGVKGGKAGASFSVISSLESRSSLISLPSRLLVRL
jgi:O-acetylhomoserine (thiol)-lyase